MNSKKFNFFEKIYWGWYQMGENLFEWQYRMTEEDYWDADFWISLNIDLSYVLETSFWYYRDYPEALDKKLNRKSNLFNGKDYGGNTPIVPDETMKEILKNGVIK